MNAENRLPNGPYWPGQDKIEACGLHYFPACHEFTNISIDGKYFRLSYCFICQKMFLNEIDESKYRTYNSSLTFEKAKHIIYDYKHWREVSSVKDTGGEIEITDWDERLYPKFYNVVVTVNNVAVPMLKEAVSGEYYVTEDDEKIFNNTVKVYFYDR